jgi:nitrile hydratase
MDSAHDLGGKEGFGSIQIDYVSDPFHTEWEGREWGIAQCALTPDMTIDWWRYCRELIMPDDYLSRPYLDSWAQTDFATYIEAGWISLEEVDHQGALFEIDSRGDPLPAVSVQDILGDERNHAVKYDALVESKPLFSERQKVVTNKQGNSGHTRLPQYARGAQGVIHAYHGAHVFPDLSAKGKKTHQHLYSVVFACVDLWPETDESNDKVFLDLWESYLTGA